MFIKFYDTSFLILLMVLIFIHESIAAGLYTRYCDRNCSHHTHTVCDRSNVKCGPGPACGEIILPFMHNEIRQAILDLHNSFRNTVAMGQEKQGSQPAASDMNILNYNYEMEHIAQCLANTCIPGHDKCRLGMSLVVGQNVGVTSANDEETITNVEACKKIVTKDWYGEVKDFNNAEVDKFFGGGQSGRADRYTQMVWGNIEYIGCGRTIWIDENNRYKLHLVCNYGGYESGGNLLYEKIYTKGTAASTCPEGKTAHKVHRGLCGELKQVDEIDPEEYKSSKAISYYLAEVMKMFTVIAVWIILS